MKANLWAGMLAILLAAGPSTGWSQRGVINPATSYDDLSKRDTRSSERDEKKKADAKKAEEAKRKAEEEKKREERRKEYEERRKNEDKDNKKPADAAKAGAAANGASANGNPTAAAMKAAMAARAKKGDGKAAANGAAGGTTDPTAREVTEVMLDSVRTQSVNFSVEAAENDPGVILLNPPKFDSSSRTRAGDAGMAQPL